MATDEPQVAECVVPDCPHCGEELVHAQRGHSADDVAAVADDSWANDVERLLGILHGDMHFWREYHTNAYLHAAVEVIRRLRQSDGVDG